MYDIDDVTNQNVQPQIYMFYTKLIMLGIYRLSNKHSYALMHSLRVHDDAMPVTSQNIVLTGDILYKYQITHLEITAVIKKL